ncbi:hypothetical protein ASF09_04050 [Sphingomonas sp. Leaf242]|nr:hypothetical protein ASF09_04050 [Sphingomonas sp. Leaf242]
MEWLRKCGKPYRITANYRSKAAPESLATRLIGGESITYGYVLSVVFDDIDVSLLFKLTFGGAA